MFKRKGTAAVKLRVYDDWDRHGVTLHLERVKDDDDSDDGYVIRTTGAMKKTIRVYVVSESILRRLQGDARRKHSGMEFPVDFPEGEKTIVVDTDCEFGDFLYGTELDTLFKYALRKLRVGTNKWGISSRQRKTLSHMR